MMTHCMNEKRQLKFVSLTQEVFMLLSVFVRRNKVHLRARNDLAKTGTTM